MLSGMQVANSVTRHLRQASTGLTPACWSASDQSTAWCIHRGQVVPTPGYPVGRASLVPERDASAELHR